MINTLEHEQQIIGSLFLDANKSLYICQKHNITPDHFKNEQLRSVYRCILDLSTSHGLFDERIVVSTLEKQGKTVELSTLDQIVQSVITAAHCEYHAKQLQDAHARTQAIALLASTLNDLNQKVLSPTPEILNALQVNLGALSGVQDARINRVIDFKNAKLDQWNQARDKGFVGIPSSFPQINKFLGGWRQSLSIIAAYRGVGKSSFIRQEALWQAKQGYKVAVFSLEDPCDIAAAGIVGNEAGISTFALDIGSFAPIQLDRMAATWDSLKDLPLWLISNTYTLDSIFSTLRMLHERYRLDIAYIDHIQYISPLQLPNMNRTNTMAVYSSRLAALPKQLGLAIVCASQLSRDCEKEDRKPRLSDLRDSGTLEQDARQILMLYRNEFNHTLEVSKNNYGPSGFSQPLEFDTSRQAFQEVKSPP